MLRRSFFKFISTAVVGASLAAHEALGELIPLPFLPAKVEEWWYLAEMVEWQVRRGVTTRSQSHVMVLREQQLAAFGLKPEDFPIKGETTDAIPYIPLASRPTPKYSDFDWPNPMAKGPKC